MRVALPLLMTLALGHGVALTAGDAPASSTAPAATAPTPATAPLPETLLLAVAKALAKDDVAALFATLPPPTQADARATWVSEKPDARESANFDHALALLLSPNAQQTLQAQIQPSLDGFNATDASAKIMTLSGLLPLWLMQAQPSGLSTQQQAMVTQVQTLLNDIGGWLPTAGIPDKTKCATAIGDLIEGVKALGIKTAADLHALPLDEALKRLGAAVKAVKQVLLVYGLDANRFLTSLTATGTAVDATHRTLTIGFTAFAHPYTVTLPLEWANGRWIPTKDAVPGLEQLKALVPIGGVGHGAGGGPAEGAAPAPSTPGPAPHAP